MVQTSSHSLDNVLPQLSVTQLTDEVDPTAGVNDTLLQGSVTDGSGIQSMLVTMLRPDGSSAEFAVQVESDDGWAFTASLDQKGEYYFYIDVIDRAGNGVRAGTIVVNAINPNERHTLYLPIINR